MDKKSTERLLFGFACKQNFPAILYNWRIGQKKTVVAFDPFFVIRYNRKRKTMTTYEYKSASGNRNYTKKIHYVDDPFEFLRRQFKKNFVCAIGYLGYRIRNCIENLPDKNIDEIGLPDLQFAFYDNAFFLTKNRHFSAISNNFNFHKFLKEHKTSTSNIKFKPQFVSNFTLEEYKKIIKRAKEYIASGDIYQVNISQQFSSSIPPPDDFDIGNLFTKSISVNPNPYTCLIGGEKSQLEFVISSSPECFLSLHDRRVITKPIKGTIRRAGVPSEDRRLIEKLLKSDKNAAELAMIVDIERNDLGKVCEYHSINVLNPRKIEKLPTLFHQVGIIEGRLRKDKDIIDLIKATFPSGSVTGAPKIRAMEIIDELETRARSVYTGAIGIITSDHSLELSIAIRILMVTKNGVFYNVGGGIVWDSNPTSEYYETILKAKGIKKIFE